MSYKIEITKNTVSIVTQEMLYDVDGNEVEMSKPKRVSYSVGDVSVDPLNPTSEERADFIKKRNKLVKKVVGKELSDI